MNTTDEKVIAARGEKIVHDLDGFLAAAYNFYDVGRAIPHPYDAIGDMGKNFLHDFNSFAYSVQQYVKLVNEKGDA